MNTTLLILLLFYLFQFLSKYFIHFHPLMKFINQPLSLHLFGLIHFLNHGNPIVILTFPFLNHFFIQTSRSFILWTPIIITLLIILINPTLDHSYTRRMPFFPNRTPHIKTILISQFQWTNTSWLFLCHLSMSWLTPRLFNLFSKLIVLLFNMTDLLNHLVSDGI